MCSLMTIMPSLSTLCRSDKLWFCGWVGVPTPPLEVLLGYRRWPVQSGSVSRDWKSSLASHLWIPHSFCCCWFLPLSHNAFGNPLISPSTLSIHPQLCPHLMPPAPSPPAPTPAEKFISSSLEDPCSSHLSPPCYLASLALWI